MTTQPEFGSVLDSLPAEAVDPSLGFYAGNSRRVAWVKPVVVCECAMSENLEKANSPQLAVQFWREVVTKNPLYDEEKETFVVLFLNRKCCVKGWNLVSLGTQTASLAHPREVLRACLVANATAFVCMHNHPSGDPSPSAADANATRMIREAAKAVDLLFLDHVIVGNAASDPLGRGFYSFREAGIL